MDKKQSLCCRNTNWIGKEIVFYETIDSTNNQAKRLAEEGYKNGTLIVANEQSAGKGRHGRSWESPKDTAIFMSLLLRPDIKPDNASMITLVSALAVSRAITKLTGQQALIKWPNDIVMNGKKVCGILTEMSVKSGCTDYIVVGIGINVNTEAFPEEIQNTATSLYLEIGEHVSRVELIGQVWEYFEEIYEVYLQTQDLRKFVKAYDERLVNKNQYVRVLDPQEPFEGKACGITERGALIVETEKERRLVSSGEVSVRGIYGYV